MMKTNTETDFREGILDCSSGKGIVFADALSEMVDEGRERKRKEVKKRKLVTFDRRTRTITLDGWYEVDLARVTTHAALD